VSAPPIPVPNSGPPLQQMPFGKYKGLPFAQVPQDYVAWLLKRDIDDRLRTALKRSNGSGPNGHVEHGSTVSEAGQVSDIGQVVAEFLQARTAAIEAKRSVEEVRSRLIPLLQRNKGAWTDIASGRRIAIQEQMQWEYDPSPLHRLVDRELLTEERFAECLRTVVDKKVVASWIEQGSLSPEQVGALNARNARPKDGPRQAAKRYDYRLTSASGAAF
jgi:Putative quorum-sensing-regulated virulence factor